MPRHFQNSGPCIQPTKRRRLPSNQAKPKRANCKSAARWEALFYTVNLVPRKAPQSPTPSVTQKSNSHVFLHLHSPGIKHISLPRLCFIDSYDTLTHRQISKPTV